MAAIRERQLAPVKGGVYPLTDDHSFFEIVEHEDEKGQSTPLMVNPVSVKESESAPNFVVDPSAPKMTQQQVNALIRSLTLMQNDELDEQEQIDQIHEKLNRVAPHLTSALSSKPSKLLAPPSVSSASSASLSSSSVTTAPPKADKHIRFAEQDEVREIDRNDEYTDRVAKHVDDRLRTLADQSLTMTLNASSAPEASEEKPAPRAPVRAEIGDIVEHSSESEEDEDFEFVQQPRRLDRRAASSTTPSTTPPDSSSHPAVASPVVHADEEKTAAPVTADDTDDTDDDGSFEEEVQMTVVGTDRQQLDMWSSYEQFLEELSDEDLDNEDDEAW